LGYTESGGVHVGKLILHDREDIRAPACRKKEASVYLMLPQRLLLPANGLPLPHLPAGKTLPCRHISKGAQD